MSSDYWHRVGDALGTLLADHAAILQIATGCNNNETWDALGHHFARELETILRSRTN